MTLSDIGLLSNYGHFKGIKFSKMIEFGVKTRGSAILLEGITIFYEAAGDGQTYARTYGMVNRADSISDNVGSMSFWMEKDEIRCQLNLLASPDVFDDLYATLCTLKENQQYNFFVTTDKEKLIERDNRIKTYSMTFVDIE